MSVDHTRCQAALGHHPDTNPAGWTWTTLGLTDPGGDGRLLVEPPPEVTLGRQDETSSTSPAEAKFSLRNPDGLLSPGDRRSTWWPQWAEGVPVRLQRRIDGTWHTRFLGEVVSIRARLDAVSGLDVVDVTAASVARRQEQGEPPMHSPLRRLILSPVNIGRLLAYWPCEDGRNASHARSPLDGVSPMTVGDLGAFAGASDHPGSAPLLRFSGAGGWSGRIPPGPALQQWRVDWFAKIDQAPDAHWNMMMVQATGTAARWALAVQSTTDVVTAAWDGDNGGLALSATTSGTDLLERWIHWSLEVTQEDSSTVRWRLLWTPFEDATSPTFLHTGTFAGTAGRPRELLNVFSGDDGPSGGFSIGQMVVSTSTGLGWLAPAHRGWPGEKASTRWTRLLTEDGVRHQLVGTTAQSPPMGRQTVTTRTALLQECADVGGVSTETPDDNGRRFRTNESIHNQTPVTLPAGAVLVPLSPSQDDLGRTNEVTASSLEGSSVTLADEAHQDGDGTRPGHGRYASTLDVNVSDDAQLPHHGSWRLTRGTWEEPRTPALNLLLSDDTAAALWADVRPGDRLIVPDGVAQGHHGPLDLIVEGWSERLGDLWTVAVNASPAGPWAAGVLDDGTGTVGQGRLLSSGTTVTAPVSESGTSLDVLTPTGPPWVNDAEQFPLDVELSTGEVVTVTACTQPVAAADVPVVRVADTFDRDETDTWGAAGAGGVWQFDEVSNTELSVSDGAGRIVMTGTPQFGRVLAVGDDLEDSEVLLSFSVDQLATGDSLKAEAVLRSASSDNYRVEAVLDTAGDVSLQIVDAGVPAVIDGPTATGETYAADDVLWVRARVDDGHRVRGRLWADGDPEPGTWLVDAVATSETEAGQVGCAFAADSSSNTNVDPTLSVHSYEAWELVEGQTQTMTVTRATNNVAKPVPVSATVQPAVPFRLPSPGSRVNARP